MATDVIAVLGELVAIDTTSATSNLALLDVVQERLGPAWRCARVPNADGTRANLVAVLGPEVAGGIVLSAHTDCVPVTGQPWDSDPFAMVATDDRVVGRGTTDMKGFLAACLVAVADLQPHDLQRPLVLALSYDEELGTVGAASLVEALVDLVPLPQAAIVGEPTLMQVVDAHKGVQSWDIEVIGRDGHSSQPDVAASAIAGAARLIAFAASLGEPDADGPRDADFDPPRTTVNIGHVRGGQAINIIPRSCGFSLEYRPVPGDDDRRIIDAVLAHADEVVLPWLRRGAPEAAIRAAPATHAPALRRGGSDAAITAARAAGAMDAPAITAPYGTDAGHFQRGGIPAVVCGPGSIEQAHQPNEWLAVDQLLKAGAFVGNLVNQQRHQGDTP